MDAPNSAQALISALLLHPQPPVTPLKAKPSSSFGCSALCIISQKAPWASLDHGQTTPKAHPAFPITAQGTLTGGTPTAPSPCTAVSRLVQAMLLHVLPRTKSWSICILEIHRNGEVNGTEGVTGRRGDTGSNGGASCQPDKHP